MLPFSQVDVFASEFMTGNPVAVVHDADELATDEMAAFARWTNLVETTFLLRPTDPAADYRLRIFTPGVRASLRGAPDARLGTRLVGRRRRTGTGRADHAGMRRRDRSRQRRGRRGSRSPRRRSSATVP